MKVRFDFIMHWLWTIVWALLALSGFSMVGAKYGWILNYNYAMAITVHRAFAAVFVLMTFISIVYDIARYIKKDTRKQVWFIIGREGYQLFTFITTLILIITGAIIWVCIELDVKVAAFALVIHEYISYIALASVIWHIYKKSHALILKKKQKKTDMESGVVAE